MDDLIASVREDIARIDERIMALTAVYKVRPDSRLANRIRGLYQLQRGLEFALVEMLRSNEGRIRF